MKRQTMKNLSILCLAGMCLTGFGQTNSPAVRTNKPKPSVVQSSRPATIRPKEVRPATRTQTVIITEVLGDFGIIKCSTSAGQLFISGLPPAFLADCKAHIAALSKAQNDIAAVARAEGLGKPLPRSLLNAKQRLKEIQAQTPTLASVTIEQTDQVYAGLKIWKFAGRIAERKSGGLDKQGK